MFQESSRKSNGFGPEALILLDFPPFLGSFFESEFLLVGNPQGVKGYACISNERTGEIFPQYFINILLKESDPNVLVLTDKAATMARNTIILKATIPNSLH